MNHIYETLKKLIRDEQCKPSYFFLDENTNEIKEKPLNLKLDSSASALINNFRNTNPLKLIHDSIFNL